MFLPIISVEAWMVTETHQIYTSGLAGPVMSHALDLQMKGLEFESLSD